MRRLTLLAAACGLFGIFAALLMLGSGPEAEPRAAVVTLTLAHLPQSATPTDPATEAQVSAPDVTGQEIALAFPAGFILTEAAADVYISAPIPVPLVGAAPFLDVGAVWQAAGDMTALRIGLRASPDGEAWGEWFDYDHFHTLDSGGQYGHLMSFDPATRYVQFRLQRGGSGARTPVVVESVRLAFISPGHTPQVMQRQIAASLSASTEPRPPVAMAVPQPVVSRTGWGCPEGQSAPNWPPQYTTVTHFIVHHTATPNNETDWPARVRSIWYYHTVTLGWGDIGYNYLIDPNGVIYEGRAGGDGSVGAHFSCVNNNTLGIALLGTYSTQGPGAAALSRLQYLLAWKAETLGINPTGSSFHNPSQLTLMNISGHRDGNSSTRGCPGGTTCPGNVLYGLLPSIRSAVAGLIVTTPTPTPTITPTPTATPTPTHTPVGYTVLAVTHLDVLHALQAQAGSPLRFILAAVNENGLDLYVEADGFTGLVRVSFQQAIFYVVFRFEGITAPDGSPAPQPFIDLVNTTLPDLLASAFDSLVTARYGALMNVENIRPVGGRLEIGLIVPP